MDVTQSVTEYRNDWRTELIYADHYGRLYANILPAFTFSAKSPTDCYPSNPEQNEESP